MESWVTGHPLGASITVWLQPRASRNTVAMVRGDALKIKVTAPPVEHAANLALVRCLTEWLDCPRHAVVIARGHTARRKVVLIVGMTPKAVASALMALQDHPRKNP